MLSAKLNDPMHSTWTQAVSNLEKVIPPQNFSNWILPIQFAAFRDDTMLLSVPNQFFKEWLEDNYLELIRSALSVAADKNLTVEFLVREEEELQPVPELPAAAESNGTDTAETVRVPPAGGKNCSPLNPRYTFSQFVSGAGNQFAHAAALAVANNPAITYNPLFIYGGVGLGKSHLLNAIGHHILDKDPSARVCYCSAEKFMHEMVNYIRLNKMDEFRARYRSVDVLLIDDIQFITGKERTQVEFFHTFNALYENHKQIAITSDKFPREMPNLEERLRSRFEWGLIADIQPPDLETKIAILKKKAELNAIRLPDDVAYFLASSDTRNIRELEGMLIRLGAYSSLQDIPITLTMAKQNLKDILVDKRKDINIELIQKTTADYFGLKVADLKSEKRLKALVQARQIALWLCRDLTTASYPDIGSKFGGKDHSTVIYSVNKIERQMAEDSYLMSTIEEIKSAILR
ncbi:chromosomal replication initiator protein DnaA [Trichlorobacter ammonificans]|uniref:Chromosomal replication initiator protein DnaA n=2 Tax=Trichlorobacter ammonificans TaxID=2916410 RepID=A0ABM9D538_9BACT|nr:chromosomal replication initiator protein DnaA [Trichlorobacter ammonificans]